MITEESCQIPVILQSLPDLIYTDDDWTSDKGRKIAIGSIAVSELNEHFEVDRLTSNNSNGYQRMPVPNRVNSLRRELDARRVDLPTAILLNLREFDSSIHLKTDKEHTVLSLSGEDRLYVVDGQHRVEALIDLYRDNASRWATYSIPFVCFLGADQVAEMTEFYVVNDNAKSIGTGLAYELIKRRAENSEAARNQLVETGKAWLRVAGVLTDKLSETDTWRGRIQFPGREKRGTLITNNGMITSLRPLVDQPGFFQSIADHDQQARVLDAYWKGIKQVVPEVMNDPETYNLQRTLGVSALHAVLVNVLAVMASKGQSVLDPDRYAEILWEPFEGLGGFNSQGEWVVGIDFWRRGREGAAGLFSGRAGRRILQAQITDKLPSVEL